MSAEGVRTVLVADDAVVRRLDGEGASLIVRSPALIGQLPTVLVVEDDRTLQETLADHLVSLGYRVATAGLAAGADAILVREAEAGSWNPRIVPAAIEIFRDSPE